MYWTNEEGIMVAKDDGQHINKLLPMTNVNGLVVDPIHGYELLLWAPIKSLNIWVFCNKKFFTCLASQVCWSTVSGKLLTINTAMLTVKLIIIALFIWTIWEINCREFLWFCCFSYLYFSRISTPTAGYIDRSFMDGSSVNSFASGSMGKPEQLTVDYKDNRYYQRNLYFHLVTSKHLLVYDTII